MLVWQWRALLLKYHKPWSLYCFVFLFCSSLCIPSHKTLTKRNEYCTCQYYKQWPYAWLNNKALHLFYGFDKQCLTLVCSLHMFSLTRYDVSSQVYIVFSFSVLCEQIYFWDICKYFLCLDKYTVSPLGSKSSLKTENTSFCLLAMFVKALLAVCPFRYCGGVSIQSAGVFCSRAPPGGKVILCFSHLAEMAALVSNTNRQGGWHRPL